MGMTADELKGREVVSIRDEKIGKIEELLTEGDDSERNWALVKMGLLGNHKVLVPMHDAVEDGGDVRVFYEKVHVHDAPEVESEDGRLGEDEADELRRYYGLERTGGAVEEDEEDDVDLTRETRDATPPGMEEGPDNPLTTRRIERAKELNVPSADDASAEDLVEDNSEGDSAKDEHWEDGKLVKDESGEGHAASEAEGAQTKSGGD